MEQVILEVAGQAELVSQKLKFWKSLRSLPN
jgi:hypothetical protein